MAAHTSDGVEPVAFEAWATSFTDAPPLLGQTRLICVDGPAGSGKTTFAHRLARVTNAPVVHMDDLYEGWEGAFAPELSTRIEAWLLTPLRHGLAPQHPRFDWYANAFAEWIEHPVSDFFILEGVGSAMRTIRRWASAVVWLECAPEQRLDRVLQRDGEAIRSQMLAFQEREELQFALEDTRAAASLIVSGEPGAGEGYFLRYQAH